MENKEFYKNVFDELRESAKQWCILTMGDVLVIKDEGSPNGFGFDIIDWNKACWLEFGLCPEEMAIEAAKNWDMNGVDKEGYWNMSHLLKYIGADYHEGRLTEQAYFEIVHTEIQFVCTMEERETQEKETTDLFGNSIF